MKVTKKKNGNALTIAAEGRIDTVTAKEFETEAKADLDGVENLTLDFSKLDYISSAGLRVLLSLQKVMSKQGSMKLIGVTVMPHLTCVASTKEHVANMLRQIRENNIDNIMALRGDLPKDGVVCKYVVNLHNKNPYLRIDFRYRTVANKYTSKVG